jgi:hypothetical protein
VTALEFSLPPFGGHRRGGFIDDHGSLTTVGAAGTYIAGISNGGLAVGGDGLSSFFYQDGVQTPFAVAGADATIARGISANGRYVTGVFTTAGGDSDGFVWDNLTSTLSTLVPAAGTEVAVIQGVTDSGLATGNVSGGPGSVLWDSTSGTTTFFTELDGLKPVRFPAIDNAGDIGGWAFNGVDVVGFIDKAGEGVHTFDFGASGGTYIYSLNNLGEAVGYDIDADGNTHSFTVDTSPVPEPASAALMGTAALAGCARFAKRRRAA